MYTAYLSDHYEPGDWEEDFDSLEDAMDALARIRDEGGDGYVLGPDGEEYDY